MLSVNNIKKVLGLSDSELHRSDFRLIKERMFLLYFEVGSEICYSVVLRTLAQLFIGKRCL